MYTVVVQFVSRVAMETIRFYIAQMSFFLRIFFFHLVGPSEQLAHMRNCPGVACKVG